MHYQALDRSANASSTALHRRLCRCAGYRRAGQTRDTEVHKHAVWAGSGARLRLLPVMLLSMRTHVCSIETSLSAYAASL